MKASRPAVTSAIVRARRERIHLSVIANLFCVEAGGVSSFEVHHRETRGVPELVAEVSADIQFRRGVFDPAIGKCHLLDGHSDILGFGGHTGQGEPHCVGAVAVDGDKGVDAVAQALGHFSAFAILYHRVDIHVFERYIAAQYWPIITIRETHSVMISRAVQRTSPG